MNTTSNITSNNSSKPIFVYVLTRVNQYGSTGTKHSTVIGVYHSEKEFQKQIEYYRLHHPSTKDTPYHFQMIKVPLDSIGEHQFEHKLF